MTERLRDIIDLLEPLDEIERRDALAAFADAIGRWSPGDEADWDVVEDRDDPECSDRVGLYLRVEADGTMTLRSSVGPGVRTVTRSLLSILCEGMTGANVGEAMDLESVEMQKVLGPELAELRGRTLEYVLRRFRQVVDQVTA